MCCFFRSICVAALLMASADHNTVKAETPRHGGTLVFAVTAEPPNYDCHANTSYAFLHPIAPHYSLLLKFDAENYPKIIGDLAQSWSISPDNLVYTFKLYPNVKFHDGSALTSADIKASYERIISPPTGVVSARQATYSTVASVEAPDPETVVFKLKEPDASFLANLASPWNCIYSAAKLAQDPKFPEKNILGSGPFKFVEHAVGSHWVAERFDQYFKEGLPYLDGYKAVFMTGAAAVNAVQGGQVMGEFRGFTPSERDGIVKALGDKVKAYDSSWLASLIIVFNTQKKPFDDPRVRRALSLAIDRWKGSMGLSRISLLGPVGGLMRPGFELAANDQELQQLPGFSKDITAARAEAKQLLKQAGVENLKFKLTNRNVTMPYSTGAVYLIDQWRQIGVTVEHEQLETKQWQAALSSGNFDVGLDFTGDFMDDPTLQLTKYLSSKISPVNYSGQVDDMLDALFVEQRRVEDKEERAKILRQFEKRVMTEAYVVPFLWWRRYVVLSSKVHGWTITPSHYLNQDLANVWLSE